MIRTTDYLKRKIENEAPLTRNKLLDLVGQAVLDLKYYQDNFHHVWPAVQKDLKRNPLHILRFITLLGVSFEHLVKDGKEVLAANLEFRCDWEPEHGLQWSIVDEKGVWVSDYSESIELKSTDYKYYNQSGNYCFHKSIY